MAEIKLSMEKKENFLILHISGEINADNTLAFRRFIEKNLPNYKTDVLFDLSGLEYINSMGIGTLIKTIKEIQHSRFKACLVGVNESIVQILKITGLIAVLHIFQTPEEGMAFLNKNSLDRNL